MIGAREVTSEGLSVAHIATVDFTHRFLLLGQLRRLRDEGFDVAAISAPGPFTDDLEAEGIRYIEWPHATRSWNPTADVRAFLELIGILRGTRFHVVHTHDPKSGVMGRLAARIARVRVVVNTVHGFYAPRDGLFRRLPLLTLEWIARRFSDLELYETREDLAWARRRRLAKSGRAQFLGNGVDLSTFDPSAISTARLANIRKEFGIPAAAQVVGSIGRLEVEKGCREFFTVAREIRREMPEVRFLMVGDLDLARANAIRRSEMSAASSDVIFTGWRRDVPHLLALMDVFVLASWRDGLLRSAIEAAAMGKPLILTDIRGCRELVRDGVEGLLVPPRDARRLARAIAELLRNPGLRQRLGVAAKRRAALLFDERHVAERVAGAYRELTNEKGIVGRRLNLEGLRSVRIRQADLGDLPALATLHTQVLPTAFMPLLGERFLRRLFRAHVEDPDAVAVVAERSGEVIGYGAGVLSTPKFRRRFLLRHGIPAAFAAAPRLLRRQTLRRVLEDTSYPEITQGFPEPEWTLVGVKRGTAPGLGIELGNEVLAALTARGANQVKAYVACDNRAMNRMVHRMGFRLGGQISLHEGQASNIWVVRCRSSSVSLADDPTPTLVASGAPPDSSADSPEWS